MAADARGSSSGSCLGWNSIPTRSISLPIQACQLSSRGKVALLENNFFHGFSGRGRGDGEKHANAFFQHFVLNMLLGFANEIFSNVLFKIETCDVCPRLRFDSAVCDGESILYIVSNIFKYITGKKEYCLTIR